MLDQKERFWDILISTSDKKIFRFIAKASAPEVALIKVVSTDSMIHGVTKRQVLNEKGDVIYIRFVKISESQQTIIL